MAPYPYLVQVREEGFVNPEHLSEGRRQGACPGPAGVDEGAVDVKEYESYH